MDMLGQYSIAILEDNYNLNTQLVRRYRIDSNQNIRRFQLMQHILR
jgi:hypothetical protein